MRKAHLTFLGILAAVVMCAQTIPFDPDGCLVNLESHLMLAEQSPESQDAIATVARCYMQLLDNLQAARWYEKIADSPDCRPEYLREYGECLKSLRLYGKAKFYFQKYAVYNPGHAAQLIQSCDIARLMMEAEPTFEVERLPFNSLQSEFAPLAFGGKLMFNSFRAGGSVVRASETGGPSVMGGHTIHAVSLPVSGTPTVQPVDFGQHNNRNIAHLRYAENGRSAVFSNNVFSNDQRLYFERAGTGIFFVTIGANGLWESVMPFAYNSNAYACAYPALSADGSTLFFASNMPGGYGGWDIYSSQRKGDTWTTPENLGPEVNTPGNEISPYLAGSTLYFSSDWHPGLGGFDIFSSHPSAEGWSNARPLGFPLNSPKDDIDFVWDAKNRTGYFSSNRIGGSGKYDLYSATPLYRDVLLTVTDQSTGLPLSGASIVVAGEISLPTMTDNRGRAMLQQSLTTEKEVRISKAGYHENAMALQSGARGRTNYEVALVPDPGAAATAPAVQRPDPGPVTPPAPTLTEPPVVTPPAIPAETRPTEPPVVSSPPVTDVPAVREQPVTKEEPRHQPPVPTAKGPDMFYVQVAALRSEASLEPYAELRRFGDLIFYEDESYSKVRVGTFATEADARNVLSQIRMNGYPDAFVVRQPITIRSATPPPTPRQITNYKVRVGTYANPGAFDAKKVEHLGTLESYPRDELTIMLLSGYASLAEAEQACNAVIELGFTDAFVVIDKQGVLERVR